MGRGSDTADTPEPNARSDLTYLGRFAAPRVRGSPIPSPTMSQSAAAGVTAAPFVVPSTQPSPALQPEFLRLPRHPKAGEEAQRDPVFSLTRQQWCMLDKSGDVPFVRLRNRGSLKPICMIPVDRARAYFHSLVKDAA